MRVVVLEGRCLQLQAWLCHLPDDYKDKNFLLHGIKFGFHIVNANDIHGYVRLRNHASVYDTNVVHKVEQGILTELSHGRYMVADVTPNIISPLGAVLKQNGDVRIIHDCSRPVGKSVNDYAPADKLHYQSLEDAKEFITPGCWLAKIDLASAYRSVKLHPSNYCATGLAWQFKGDTKETILVDRMLCFGAKRAPFIFTAITQAIVYIMKCRGFNVICYLDDFLLGATTYEGCLTAFNALLGLLRELSFSISYPKLVPPTQSIVFLGIAIDTIAMTFSLPHDKLTGLRHLVDEALAKRTFKKHYLQVLAGRLGFATRIYYGGLCFLRRVIDIINRLRKPWSRFCMTGKLLADLLWWRDILTGIKGTASIIDNKSALSVIVDRRADVRQLSSKPSHGEVLAVVAAAFERAHVWANQRVYVHCNSIAAAAIINKGSCRDAAIMQHLRELWKLSTIFNFRLTARVYHYEPQRSQFGQQCATSPRSGSGTVNEGGISSSPRAVPALLPAPELLAATSRAGDYSALHSSPGVDSVTAVHSVSPISATPATRRTGLSDGHPEQPAGALHVAGCYEIGRFTATSDEAYDCRASKAPLPSAQLSHAGGLLVLGSVSPNVLFTIAPEQHVGDVRQSAGTTRDAQKRCRPSCTPGATHHTLEQDIVGCTAAARYCYSGSPGPPHVSGRSAACDQGHGPYCTRDTAVLSLAQRQGVLLPALYSSAPSFSRSIGGAAQCVWVPQLSPWWCHPCVQRRGSLGVHSAPWQLEVGSVHSILVRVAGRA